MALVDSRGNPVQPKLENDQIMQLMTGLRIRIDAANAQLVQLGLLVEYLYEQLAEAGTTISMEKFPKWAEARYAEIQKQAQEAVDQSKEEVSKIKESLKEELTDFKQGVKDTLAQHEELSKIPDSPESDSDNPEVSSSTEGVSGEESDENPPESTKTK